MSCESRLQKLLNLLENSTENEAREAAGHAIRDIAAAHPQQLPAILHKIGTLLRNKQWDCRVAAGDTLRLLAQHFRHHSVDDLRRISSIDDADLVDNKKPKYEEREDTITDALRHFDVDAVLSKGPLLVACGPRLQEQEDGNGTMHLHKSLSSRERNQWKRRQRSQEQRPDMDSSHSTECPSSVSSMKSEEKDEILEDTLLDGRWPFLGMFQNLMTDVLDPVWEIRHGAVLGLRELLSHQALSAGVDVPLVQDVPSGWAVAGKTTLRDVANVSDTDVQKNRDANRQCLEACCARLLHLLVVDRMGDYLTDQTVAPVRETATQAFGCCLSALPLITIQHFHRIIQCMTSNAAWEVRHSGYLLLKYLMAARRHLDVDIDGWKACVLNGLKDNIEDVRASAADALIPIASILHQRLSPSELRECVDVLWSDANLGDEDILNAAVPSVLDLLCKLYGTEEQHCMHLHLNDRLPTLFRFFTHPTKSVRTSAIRCFQQMLTLGSQLRPFFRQATRLIFFNLLTETDVDILQLNEATWSSIMELYNDPDLKNDIDDRLMRSMMQLASTPIGTTFCHTSLDALIDGVVYRDRDLKVGSQFAGNPFRMRLATTAALAILFERLPERHPILLDALQLSSATAQQTSALIMHFWENITSVDAHHIPPSLRTAVSELLERNVPYTELLGHERKLRNDFGAFLIEVMQHTKIDVKALRPDTLTPEQMDEHSRTLMDAHPHTYDRIVAQQQHVSASVRDLKELHLALGTQVRACAATAVVDGGCIPPKLNSIIRPLMAGVRTEREPLLQHLFATRLARLIVLCQRKKEAARKMVSNVCNMACDGTILESHPQLSSLIEKSGLNAALGVQTDGTQSIAKSGAAAVLQSMAEHLSSDLFSIVPTLWNEMTEGLTQSPAQKIYCIELMQILGPLLAPELLSQLKPFVELICGFCCAPVHPVRIVAARCCSALVSSHLDILMPVVLEQFIPALAPDGDPCHREGALIALHHILEKLGSRVVPYIVLLIVPLLRLMANYDPTVRTIAASCFGKLTSLIPLTPSVSPPPNLTSTQQSSFQKNANFVMQLMNNKKTGDFDVPDGLGVNLRNYQKEGINWMRFLRRFGLHGILADDMGLGKTIQTLVSILVSKWESETPTMDMDVRSKRSTSLVVCPATLISHWCIEARTQLPSGSLSALPFVGTVGDRVELRQAVDRYDLIVMSYETLRADIQWISGIPWHYCILDEGHIIRNTESKIWKACKAVNANHRLILSGTPVQNSVLELWSLFDFLCPGFLGTKRDFMQQYGRAVHAARYAKKGTAENIGSELALTALHKRVMPFILRRTKDEVLHDLPPKIIQDAYCDLSSLQRHLYEDFSRRHGSNASTGTSSFQSLRYLGQLCSHPLLAIDWQNPVHRTIVSQVMGRNFTDKHHLQEALSGLEHAPKLQLLQQLLSECGILSSSSPLEDGQNGSHRMLIFAQLKGLLTIVEEQLLIPQQIAHLRLDGSVPALERQHIIHLFNSDPTIPVMLLTTKVGGLGLNLTAADVVVFLEHDWNPRNDQQAMDRTHRLGQTRVVNVYRILTRGTLEEKIMNLQKFKMGIADSVINRDNMSLDSMDTSHLLDLFTYSNGPNSHSSDAPAEVDDDYTDRYRKEFDMERFTKSKDCVE